MQAQLKESESAFDGNANSIEALTEKDRLLKAQSEKLTESIKQSEKMQQTAAKAADEHRNKLDALQKELEELAKTEGKSADEKEKLAQKSEELQNDIAAEKNAVSNAERAETKYATAASKTRTQLNNLNKEIKQNEQYLDEAKNSADGAAKSIDEYGNKAKKATPESDGFAEALKDIGVAAAVASTLKAAGEAALDMANDLGEANAIIVKATGASGDKLKEFNDIAARVYGNVDTDDFSSVAEGLGEINTRLEAQGDELEELTKLFVEYADATDSDVKQAVKSVSDVIHSYNVELKDTGDLLDKLTVAGQISGISVDSLSDQLTKNKASLQALGYDLTDSIALLSAFEKSGINSEAALTGLRQGIAKLAKDGKEGKEGLQEVIDLIKAAGSESESNALAIEYFGNRAGLELAHAIRNGRFELEEFTAALNTSGGAMQKTADNSDTYIDAIQQIKNSLFATTSAFVSALQPVDRYGEALEKGTAALDDARSKTNEYNAALRSTEYKFDAAERYAERLAAIADEGELTAAQQEEYAGVVAGLNSLLPELNLTIDENTGRLSLNTEEIYENISALKEQYAAEAALARNEDLIESLGSLSLAIEQNNSDIQAQKTAIEESKAAATAYALQIIDTLAPGLDTAGMSYDQLIDKAQGLAAGQNTLTSTGDLLADSLYAQGSATWDLYSSMSDAARAAKEEEEALKGTEAALRENETAYSELENELQENTTAYERGVEIVGEYASVQGEAAEETEKVTALTEEQQQALTEYGDKSGEVVTTLEKAFADVEKAYTSAYNTALSSLKGQMGLFDDVAEASKVDTDEIIRNWERQAEYYAKAEENLKRFSDSSLGVSEDLVKALGDGTAENNAFIDEFLRGYDSLEGEGEELVQKQKDYVAKFNESFAGMNEGREAFAEQIAGIQSELESKLAEIEKLSEDTANKLRDDYNAYYNAASSNMTGLVKGYQDKYAELSRAVDAVRRKTQELAGGNASHGPAPSVDGSHSAGLAYVPYDGYIAELHKGERILRAQEARLYNAAEVLGTGSHTASPKSVTVNVYTQSMSAAEQDRLVDIVNRRLGR